MEIESGWSPQVEDVIKKHVSTPLRRDLMRLLCASRTTEQVGKFFGLSFEEVEREWQAGLQEIKAANG